MDATPAHVCAIARGPAGPWHIASLTSDSPRAIRHAERDASGWTLADLGSRNGTFLNGHLVRSAPLYYVPLAALLLYLGQRSPRRKAPAVALLVAAVLVYLLGVQLPTATINIPLNNSVQALEIDAMDEAALATARREFEARWNRWNSIRTVLACLVSVLLLVLLSRL